MNNKDTDTYNTRISESLFELLKNKYPNEASHIHLKDIVFILMDALEKGETQINLGSSQYNNLTQGSGWPNVHKEALIQSGWLNDTTSPIVLKENILSWRRWHEETESVVIELIERSKLLRKNNNNRSSKTRGFVNIDHRNKEQIMAIKAIENEGILLISGGPGTGKTSTVVGILQHALEIEPLLNIGLAAPTGKATSRLQKSLHSFELINPKKLANINCSTIHRWLESTKEGYRKNKNNKLQIDLMVIDEMSMVDLSLMRAILDALPEETKLILVGDSDQLPPIGCGAIWHKLQEHIIRKQFQKGSIQLKKTYRNRGALAKMSKIINNEGVDVFWEKVKLLSNEENIRIHEHGNYNIPNIIKGRIRAHLESLSLASNEFISSKQSHASEQVTNQLAFKLFNILDRLIVLCPKRNGSWGVGHINSTFLGIEFNGGPENWPEGTPVICCTNQPEIGLANGDVGVTINNLGACYLLFNSFTEIPDIQYRLIHPARLKTIEPAIATTIHKAQGSEADQVILLWPNKPSTINNYQDNGIQNDNYTSKLLYTAITRTREKIDIICPKTSSQSCNDKIF